MKLKLLDIDKFITKNKLKLVTNAKLYEKPGKLDPSGLFSEEIFGRFGSIERRRTFAYVNLNCRIIHPEVYPIIAGLHPIFSKLLLNKGKYIVTENGALVEDSSGKSGISYLIEIFPKIDLNKYEKNQPKRVQFLKKNLELLFVDKWLILPAGIRDISISKTSGQTLINFSDLSELYVSLIRSANMIHPELPEDIKQPMVEQIQKLVIEINDWIKNRMKGKQGIIRGGLLRKTVDYSARLVATTDHTLPLGTIGLPWQIVLKLYEPFAINYILRKDTTSIGIIQNFLRLEKSPGTDELKKLFSNLTNNPEIITPQLKAYLIQVAEEIVKDKVVIYKRDPVENRDSWLAANIRVEPEGLSLKLNPLDLPRTGGDHDGDTYAVIALFTKEAQEEAKRNMHPRYTEAMWTNVTSANNCPYQLTLDAITAIYAATKA